MKKYYNLSEGGVNSLSQPITEDFCENTIFAKLTNAKQQNQLANNVKRKGNTDKKSERQRSVTEVGIFKDIAQQGVYNFLKAHHWERKTLLKN